MEGLQHMAFHLHDGDDDGERDDRGQPSVGDQRDEDGDERDGVVAEVEHGRADPPPAASLPPSQGPDVVLVASRPLRSRRRGAGAA